MKEVYREAFSEIDAIFELMPKNLISKIPERFREFIRKEKSIEYKPIITEPIENFSLKEETIIILALIYRDFLCNEEEKEQLKLRDVEKAREAEEEIRKKYNPEDIFKKGKKIQIDDIKEKEEQTYDKQLIIVEEKWYTKIFNMIKKIFKKT